MTHQPTPQIDAFRSIVRQAGTLHAELSTLDAAIRDLESIKVRMGDCRDEVEARKLLDDLTRAEQAVTIKRIREPRLRADIDQAFTGVVQVCIDAFTEADKLLTAATAESVAAFGELLRSIQPEPDAPKTEEATGLTVKAVRPNVIAMQQREALDRIWPGSSLDSDSHDLRVRGAGDALAVLDMTLAALPQIIAEAKRLTAACEAFRKVLANR